MILLRFLLNAFFSRSSAPYSMKGISPLNTFSELLKLLFISKTLFYSSANTIPNGRTICPRPPTIATS